MDTYDYENSFLNLDNNFREIKNLKELYITFNKSTEQNETTLFQKIDELIHIYKGSKFTMFKDFAGLLERYKVEFINSFIRVPKANKGEQKTQELRRLSNGPIEGFNRKPKDLKRKSRGVQNIEYTRNRLFWSSRENNPILGSLKTKTEIYKFADRPRGPYNKYKN